MDSTEFSRIKAYLKSKEYPQDVKTSAAKKGFKKKANKFILEGETLCYKKKTKKGVEFVEVNVKVLQPSETADVFREFLASSMGGHTVRESG